MCTNLSLPLLKGREAFSQSLVIPDQNINFRIVGDQRQSWLAAMGVWRESLPSCIKDDASSMPGVMMLRSGKDDDNDRTALKELFEASYSTKTLAPVLMLQIDYEKVLRIAKE